MDLFKYGNVSTFTNASPIIGQESVMWTERYKEPGEFEIKARLSSGLKTSLPIGSVISHVNTLEAMYVENHQITEESEADPIITITGRSFESVLENRVVGTNFNWATLPPASLAVSQYDIAAANTWLQIKTMIEDHAISTKVINASDALSSVVVATSVTGSGTSEARTIARGHILERVIELLEIDDCGIKSVRPHLFTGMAHSGSNLTLLIHRGEDKKNKVIFSSKVGDIDSADFLWSIRKYKNAALVTGKFVEQMVPGSATGLDKRVMLVDGSDIDGHLETTPTGGTLTTIRNKMTVRGGQALKKQKRLSISRTDISETPTFEYRRDYNIGDLVSIQSNYGPLASTRVIEHVEIEDETGFSAHPTLEIIE